MRPYVKLFKDGDSMAVETNCTTEEEFLNHLISAVSEIVEANKFKGDWPFQFQKWIPQSFEILAKLRGYKAEVEEQRVLRAGAGTWAEEKAVVSTASDLVPAGDL